MSKSLNISPKIILSIASLYNDTNRIFMEYIDNSLDSAEEFFDREANLYKKAITITLTVRKGSVSVKDNCHGITNFTKVIESVGDSDKKGGQWTNGQFGYGIYSFMAACGKLEITSRLRGNSSAEAIVIRKSMFDKKRQEEVIFPDPSTVEYSYDSGTEVVLSEFDKDMWKQIDFDEIKTEIEKHFELLLARGNLEIRLINEQSGVEYLCQPFDYNQYEGDQYDNSCEKLLIPKRGRARSEDYFRLPRPIRIFLKITKGVVIKKPPVFITKGRRIAEVKDIRSFKSKYKSEIWNHPNMTGFIDLDGFLDPTIARNEFRNNPKSSALFNQLKVLEQYILEFIQEVNKKTEARHYQNFEGILTKALAKLAKVDRMNYRTGYLSGNGTDVQKGGSGQSFEEGYGEKDRGGQGSGGGGEGWGGENEGDGMGPSGKPGTDTSGGKDGGDGATDQKSDGHTGFEGGAKKRSGLDIRFVDDEIIDDATGKPLRSQLIGGTVRIFKEHEDFQRRVEKTRTKESKITQRLITYISGEITVHYKDIWQTRNGQPEYNRTLFEDLVEFIYRFEDELKGLVGQKLSDVTG